MSGIGNTTTFVNLSGNILIDSLLTQGAWADSTVNYSFALTENAFNYFIPEFLQLFAAQEDAAHFSLSISQGPAASAGFSFEGFTNQDVRFMGNTDEGTAHLRYTATNGSGGQVFDFPVGVADDDPANDGDLELGIGHSWANGVSVDQAQAGDAHWQHMLHETGHALGLKHPHDTFFPSGVMPDEFDHYEYTVMSYRRTEDASWRTLSEVAPNDWPQSFMMLDIQALQYMYGADYTTNSSDTVYSWVPGSGPIPI